MPVVGESDGPSIDVVVLWEDGTPAVNLSVTLDSGAGSQASRRTDPDGRLRFERVSPAEHSIRCWAREGIFDVGCGAQALVRAGDSAVRLVLPCAKPLGDPEFDPRTVTFLVVDGAGNAVPRAEIDYFGRWSSTVRVRDGHATVPAVGLERVLARSAESAPDVPLPLGPVEWIGPAHEDGTEIVLRMPPELAISGRVLDPSGRGVPGVAVEADPAERRGGYQSPPARTTSGVDGVFRVGGLGPGEFDIYLDAPPGLLRPEPQRIAAGVLDATVVLRVGVSATVTVVDAAGRPAVGAKVRVDRPYGDSVEATTDASGKVELSGLDPECPYDLSARATSESDGAPPSASLDRWLPKDATLTLHPFLGVRVVVRDTTGHPVPWARVWEQTDHLSFPQDEDGINWMSFGTADEDGRARAVREAGRPLRLRAEVGPEVVICGSHFGHENRNEVSIRRSAVADVTPGRAAGEVALTIDLGVPLDARFDGWPSATPVVQAVLSVEPSAGKHSRPDGPWDCLVDPTGRTHFRFLDPERTYSIWVGPVGGRLVGFACGLRGGETERHVALVEGKETRGRLHVPPGAFRPSVVADVGASVIEAHLEANGDFRFPALPPGTWTLRAAASASEDEFVPSTPGNLDSLLEAPVGPDFSGTATVVAGGSADIVLVPRK
jgi:hypothetical protein